MRVLFFLGHPAHFHLFRNIIYKLRDNHHEIKIVIKKKDILEDLLKIADLEFINILPKGRGEGKIAIVWSVLKKDLALFKIVRSFKPHVMIGTSTEITHVGRLTNTSSMVVNEDDFDVVPLFSRMAYPFANSILAPSSCRVGKWEEKRISYEGYHELTYLHPNYFKPDHNIINMINPEGTRYFILRFAKLSAHHDAGKSGINDTIAARMINILEHYGKIFITSEKELNPEFEKYRIKINPLNIHHVLQFADLYIGDSQTMTAEAAVLGTPAIRFNDFVGKLGYLEELEHKYGLTYGIKTSDPSRLFDKIEEILNTPNLREEWQKRRQKMLSEKIDVASFMTWFIENYPESTRIMKENPDHQYKFI